MDRTTRQKINGEIDDLNNTPNQLHLMYICRKIHPKIAEYTFFSSACRTFSVIDCKTNK